MIISHEHKFIFLKTAKTAGTSIEIALSKFCGSDDVITKIARPDQRIRSEVGYPGPQNGRPATARLCCRRPALEPATSQEEPLPQPLPVAPDQALRR